MRWCRICGMTLLFLFPTTHFARAYERDVHYDLTKYLARWAGFSETEAEQIAAADQELDAKPEFNPLPNIPQFCPHLSQLAVAAPTPAVVQAACKDDPEFQRMLTAQRAFHFVDGARLKALRDNAFRGKNPKTLGHYLHALQDTFAHSLMDYQELPPIDKLVASLGFMPDEKIIGHLMYGHSVDKTYERPNLAELMARYVYTELTHFKGSANRWSEMEASIARFVRERDAQKKLVYLSPSPASQAAQMLSQPQGPAQPSQEAMATKRTYAQPVNDQFMTDTTIDNETGVRFSRVFYGTPDISVLKGIQCGWSIEVIGELPRSRDPSTDEMVKTILVKGKNFALPFVCPATERIRVFLLDSTFTTILDYKPRAKVEGDFSSGDNFETVADYRTQTPAPRQAASQHEQESKSLVEAQQKQGAPVTSPLSITQASEPVYAQASPPDFLTKTTIDPETKVRFSLKRKYKRDGNTTVEIDPCRFDVFRQPTPVYVIGEVPTQLDLADDALAKRLLERGRLYAVEQCGKDRDKANDIEVLLYQSPPDNENWSTSWVVKGKYAFRPFLDQPLTRLWDYENKPLTAAKRIAREEEERRQAEERRQRVEGQRREEEQRRLEQWRQAEAQRQREEAENAAILALGRDVPDWLVRKVDQTGMQEKATREWLARLKRRNGRYCLSQQDKTDWFRGGVFALWSMTQPGGLLPDCSTKEIERTIFGISLGQSEATVRASLTGAKEEAEGVSMCLVKPTEGQDLKVCFYEGRVVSIEQIFKRDIGDIVKALRDKYGKEESSSNNPSHLMINYNWDDVLTHLLLVWHPQKSLILRYDNDLQRRALSAEEKRKRETVKKKLREY